MVPEAVELELPPCARCGTFVALAESGVVRGQRYCAACAQRPEVKAAPPRVLRETLGYLLWAAAAFLLGYVCVNPLFALAAALASLPARALFRRFRGPPTGREVPAYAWMLAGASALPAPLLFLGLNFLRPDLIRPFMDHLFGLMIFSAEALMISVAAGAVLLAAGLTLARPRPLPVVATWVAGLVICVAPAIFLVLFGPIIFAFMYGNAA